MIALITLVIPVGGSAGPFDLYSDANGYTIPFATNISAAVLQAGYTSNVVPNGTTIIRVTSVGICTNSVDTPINLITTTTTSSTSTSSTSTTSTSTTIAQACYVYDLTATIDNASWTAQLCSGGVTSGVLPFIGNTITTPCIINTSLVLTGITAFTNSIDCSTTTTTSSSTSTSTSSTTTTTTTCACVDYNVVIGPIDIAASAVDVQYVNCAGDTTVRSSEVVTTFSVCVKSGNIPLIFRETPPSSVVDSSITITSNCCNTTTTTTTTAASTTSSTTTTPDIAPGVALTWTADNGPFTSIVFQITRKRAGVETVVSQKTLNNGNFPDPSGNYNGGAGSTFYSSLNPLASDAQLSLEGFYQYPIPSGLQTGDEIRIYLATTNISSQSNGGPVGSDVQSTLILRRTLRTVSSYATIDTQSDSGPSPSIAYIPMPPGAWYTVDPLTYIYEVIAITEISS
jgi:hypothetical protein